MMKKLMFFLLCITAPSLYADSGSCSTNSNCCSNEWYKTVALTSGYVFKHDDTNFKQTYGRGMGNVITADFYFSRCNRWGIGAKGSYWIALGKTTFFRHHTTLHQIPLTAYVRRTTEFECGLQLYASLGGGVTWIKENSYLGHSSHWKGIGEVEAGLIQPMWECLDFTFAFRYLFPRQKIGTVKVDVGGFDLRAGVQFPF